MRAIGYVRCSTMEQADSGLGLEAQEQRIRGYCALRNCDETEIIFDRGVSGGKRLADREGGRQLLKALRCGDARAVVMLKLDRGFRNAGDCLNTVEQWDRLGVSLHVVDLGGNAIDTSSAAGKFMLTVLAGAAEMERNLTRERTRSAMAVKRANGQRVGTVPYGFDLADDGNTLTPNPTEQAAVAQMRQMRARGWSFEAIVEELGELDIPTKTGRPKWSHQAVRRILARETDSVVAAP